MNVLVWLVVALLWAPSQSSPRGSAHGSAPGLSPAKVAHLAWLEGHWVGSDGPLQMEEIWTSAAGGTIVGLHKDVSTRDGTARMLWFEFQRIEAGADGIAYVAQPGGQPPTRFALIEQADAPCRVRQSGARFPAAHPLLARRRRRAPRPHRRPEGRQDCGRGMDVDASPRDEVMLPRRPSA